MFNENSHIFVRFQFLEYPPILSSYMLTVCGKFARQRPHSERAREFWMSKQGQLAFS